MKKLVFPISGLMLILLILAAIPRRDTYRVPSAEVLEELMREKHFITSAELDSLRQKDDFLLVDLSERSDFHSNEETGVINFPISQFNPVSVRKCFRQARTYVLYSSEPREVSQAWTLLRQMGIPNIRILETPQASVSSDEKPAYTDPGP